MTKFFALIFLFSCSSSVKETMRGYGSDRYIQIENNISGKSPDAVRKYLGKPAIEGLCKSCVKSGLYRMIYPTKDMQKFYLEITYNTDVELECTVIDFQPIKTKKTVSYIFPKKGKIRKFLRCNQKEGAILKLQEEIDSQT